MDSNNAILFSFGLVFLLIGVFSPMINAEFGNQYNDYDTDGLIDDSVQGDTTSTTAIQVISSVFFWVFGAPFWLNIILTMMRLIFWVIVYDKVRGI